MLRAIGTCDAYGDCNTDGAGSYDPTVGGQVIPYGSAGGQMTGPSFPTGVNPLSQLNNGGAPWYAGLTNLFAGTASKIALANYGQPQLPPGTFIRNADGSIVTNTGAGAGSSLLTSFGSGGGFSTSTLLIVGAIIGAIVLFKGR